MVLFFLPLVLLFLASSCSSDKAAEDLYGDAPRRPRVAPARSSDFPSRDATAPPSLFGAANLDAARASDGAGGDAPAEASRRDVAAPWADVSAPSAPPPPSCAEKEKLCGRYCVEVTDPRFGCAAISCDPCAPPAANMESTCTASGACLAVCAAGYLDCDQDVGNGCEIDSRSNAAHCGACGTRCETNQTCTDGRCVARDTGGRGRR